MGGSFLSGIFSSLSYALICFVMLINYFSLLNIRLYHRSKPLLFHVFSMNLFIVWVLLLYDGMHITLIFLHSTTVFRWKHTAPIVKLIFIFNFSNVPLWSVAQVLTTLQWSKSRFRDLIQLIIVASLQILHQFLLSIAFALARILFFSFKCSLKRKHK